MLKKRTDALATTVTAPFSAVEDKQRTGPVNRPGFRGGQLV